MSGRVLSQVAAQGEPLSGLVLLGYALHATGRADRLRTEHWPALTCPVLLISGTADSLCEPAALSRAARALVIPPAVHWVPDADHALGVPGDPVRTLAAHDQVAATVSDWVRVVAGNATKGWRGRG